MSNEFLQAEGTLTITADMLERMNDHGSGLKAELQRRLAEQKAAKRQTDDRQEDHNQLDADAERSATCKGC